MSIANITRRVGIVTLMAASLISTTQAGAQAASGKVVDVPCCTCIGGQARPIIVSTGAATWEVAPPGSTAFVNTTLATVNQGWTATLPGAAWVGPANNTGAPAGTYTFRLRFRVPKCVIPGRVTISGRFAADNGAQVFIDGAATPIASSGGVATRGYQTAAITPFSQAGFAPGMHEIVVRVNNIGGPIGLLMDATIANQCSSAVETR
ncbi:MAG: hypothetical protein B7Y97_13145 [Sphingomonas sp. 32-66-10]|nr:MAG: hypothetical protein B7Y97_13145 [Sphingomonas sp. 32-66-10]